MRLQACRVFSPGNAKLEKSILYLVFFPKKNQKIANLFLKVTRIASLYKCTNHFNFKSVYNVAQGKYLFSSRKKRLLFIHSCKPKKLHSLSSLEFEIQDAIMSLMIKILKLGIFSKHQNKKPWKMKMAGKHKAFPNASTSFSLNYIETCLKIDSSLEAGLCVFIPVCWYN